MAWPLREKKILNATLESCIYVPFWGLHGKLLLPGWIKPNHSDVRGPAAFNSKYIIKKKKSAQHLWIEWAVLASSWPPLTELEWQLVLCLRKQDMCVKREKNQPPLGWWLEVLHYDSSLSGRTGTAALDTEQFHWEELTHKNPVSTPFILCSNQNRLLKYKNIPKPRSSQTEEAVQCSLMMW